MFYLDLFAALDHHHVDYVLIGGLAVSLHGIERATMDVDICVGMTSKNIAAFIDAARELSLTPRLPVPMETLLDMEQLKEWRATRHLEAFALKAPGLAGVTIDILLFPPVSFSDLASRAAVLPIGDIPVRLAAIDDLIALKQSTGRPIDLMDVEHLKRLKELGT